MSFGFSVGDIIATAQLCRSVVEETLSRKWDSSSSSPRAIQALKRIQLSLDKLTDGLTSSESSKVLAQESLQQPLRDGLSQIRRDVEAFSEISRKRTLVRRSQGLSIGRDLRHFSSNKEVEACIERLSEEEAKLQHLLYQVISTNSKELLLSLENLSVANSSEEDSKIRQWLFRSGQWEQEERHAQLVSSREEQTGLWILEDPRYQMWKDSQNSLLWLWGIPGSGKSVLSAHVVETLRLDDARSHQVAFYHFTVTDNYGSSLERCLMSLIGQISSKEQEIPEALRRLYYDHAGGTMLPSIQALQEIMFLLLSMQSSCYIVLDAIDECSKLEETLDVINALRRPDIKGPQNLRIIATSRKLYEIEAALIGTCLDSHTVFIQVDARDDIQRFIERELDRSPRFSSELKEHLLASLLEKSDGLFELARLALDSIHRARTIRAVKKIINEPLPQLDTMYENILLKTPPQNYGMVRRILIWIMNSARPLTADEVSDAIVLNTTGKTVSPDDRLIDSDDILKMLSSVLEEATEVNDDTGRPQTTLRLIHVSFMDFLKSKRTVGPLVDFPHSGGDRILADCCITYLLTFNENSLPDGDLSAFPLLSYAAEYWFCHARRTEEAHLWHPETTQLIMRLFHDKNGDTFLNWLKVFDPAARDGFSAFRRNVETFPSPLFYASLLGLRHVLELLIGPGGTSPAAEFEASLFAAAGNGYSDIVRLLLEQGASPNAENWSGGRPLDVAILNSHTSVVELLLQYNADVTYQDGIIGSPFQTATGIGDVALTNLILSPTKTKLTPEAFLALLSQGLHDAARSGHLQIVQLLFDADENGHVDAVDKAGWTALHYAIRYKREGVQQYLIDHGADIDKKNLAGETPADFAWSDRRLDLSLYNKVTDLEKEARQAFSCHILQEVSDAGDCRKSIFRKTFKFKNKNRAAKPKAKKAIIREHTILQRINHPFIVSYLWYEEDKEQETAQLYLEYCNGGDLDAYSARAIATGEEESSSDENDQATPSGPCLMPKDLWRYMFQVAAALAYLHHGLSLHSGQVFIFEKHWDQILHRDIKPSNIVLNFPQSGLPQAKICDLGLAKGLSSKLREAKETGGIGTRNYWPPEMFQKDGFWTVKGDIYSYGSTFNDLWTKSARSSRDCRSWKEILGKCMSILPADRPSSIELLEMTQEHVTEELPSSTSNLHGLLGQSQAGYLGAAFYKIASQLDTKETFESRSVKVRRATLIKRLKLLCDDGAGSIFDEQPGPLQMRLHIAVLLNRKAAFDQAVEMQRAINTRWSDSGWTPLHLAAQEENIEMYTRLIEANADPLVSDRSGHIASFYIPQSERGMYPK